MQSQHHLETIRETSLDCEPLKRGNGEQVRQYSLVAAQVEVATEPVVDRQRRAGLVFCRALAARAGRSRRSPGEGDEAGQPADAAANADATLRPAGGAQPLQRSGRLRGPRNPFNSYRDHVSPRCPAGPLCDSRCRRMAFNSAVR